MSRSDPDDDPIIQEFEKIVREETAKELTGKTTGKKIMDRIRETLARSKGAKEPRGA